MAGGPAGADTPRHGGIVRHSRRGRDGGLLEALREVDAVIAEALRREVMVGDMARPARRSLMRLSAGRDSQAGEWLAVGVVILRRRRRGFRNDDDSSHGRFLRPMPPARNAGQVY